VRFDGGRGVVRGLLSPRSGSLPQLGPASFRADRRSAGGTSSRPCSADRLWRDRFRVRFPAVIRGGTMNLNGAVYTIVGVNAGGLRVFRQSGGHARQLSCWPKQTALLGAAGRSPADRASAASPASWPSSAGLTPASRNRGGRAGRARHLRPADGSRSFPQGKGWVQCTRSWRIDAGRLAGDTRPVRCCCVVRAPSRSFLLIACSNIAKPAAHPIDIARERVNSPWRAAPRLPGRHPPDPAS